MPSGVVGTIRAAAGSLAQGRHAEAEAAIRTVLEVAPDQPDALHVLGLICYQTKRLDESIEHLSRALAIDGKNESYRHNLGLSLCAAGRWAEAEAAFRLLLEHAAGKVDYQVALGQALLRQDKPAEAEEFLRAAVERQPRSFAAVSQLAAALEEQGNARDAEAYYRRALEIDETAAVYINLGNVLRDQHRADEALAAYDRAIELEPRYAEAHVQAAFALLLKGDYAKGWREYEWRWAVPAFAGTIRKFPQPVWDGLPLAGRTLFLYAEQGFGDTLQFARYADVAARTGGNVILECQPALARLMRSAAGVAQVVAHGDPLSAFDCHAPLLSVPRLVGTTLKTVPANVPYLAAEPAPARTWRKRLAGEPGLKVGVAWRGTAERRGNPARACPLSAFRPFLESRDFRLYSLQKEIAAADRPLPAGLADLSAALADFADTAAVVEALDLVVSIDTAVAHLAGALGKPTFLLLSTAGDWRWLTKRRDSPWYPSMRIFRQARPGDWTAVVTAAFEAARRVRPAKA